LTKKFTAESAENAEIFGFKKHPFSHGWWRTNFVAAWGFGRYAPEASAGIGRDSEKIPTNTSSPHSSFGERWKSVFNISFPLKL
jgi:hypothetical protein